ncbi:dipicolinate synthase subunit A, partial [Klebsiella pneumoniae]
MLTEMHIAVIGGDARQLEVIRKLVELDAKLSLIGFDQLDHGFTGAAKESIQNLDFT